MQILKLTGKFSFLKFVEILFQIILLRYILVDCDRISSICFDGLFVWKELWCWLGLNDSPYPSIEVECAVKTISQVMKIKFVLKVTHLLYEALNLPQ